MINKPQTVKIDSLYTLHLCAIDANVEITVNAFGLPVFSRCTNLETAQDLRDKLDAVICAAQLARVPK